MKIKNGNPKLGLVIFEPESEWDVFNLGRVFAVTGSGVEYKRNSDNPDPTVEQVSVRLKDLIEALATCRSRKEKK